MGASQSPIRRVFLLGLSTVLALTACSPHPVIPASPVGEKAQWMLTLLNAGLDVTGGELEPHLDESLISERSAEEFAEQINEEIRPDRPFIAIEHRGQARESVTRLEGRSGVPWQMSMAVDQNGESLTALLFAPAGAAGSP